MLYAYGQDSQKRAEPRGVKQPDIPNMDLYSPIDKTNCYGGGVTRNPDLNQYLAVPLLQDRLDGVRSLIRGSLFG